MKDVASTVFCQEIKFQTKKILARCFLQGLAGDRSSNVKVALAAGPVVLSPGWGPSWRLPAAEAPWGGVGEEAVCFRAAGWMLTAGCVICL